MNENEMNRYMIIIIGNSKGIEKDLNHIADADHGIDFVESKVLFLGTFYSPFSSIQIHEKLIHRPAFLLFDISDNESYGVNLPSKYYTGLFPESMDMVGNIMDKPKTNSVSKAKSKAVSKKKKIEEYTNLNDILDKLSKNDYDRECLTENEIKILENQ